jgi:hypothetical protein
MNIICFKNDSQIKEELHIKHILRVEIVEMHLLRAVIEYYLIDKKI